jgi:hypothetical protein
MIHGQQNIKYFLSLGVMTMGNGTTDSWKTLPEEIILETGVRMTSY